MSNESDYFAAVLGLVGTALGAVLGYLLSRNARNLDDEQRARGYLLALQLDLIECERLMQAYQTDYPTTRIGRCPTNTWQLARSFLAGSQSVSVEDLMVVDRFFSVAEQFNACLDRAGDADREKLARGRAVEALTIGHELGRDGSRVNAATAARQALNRSIARVSF